MKWVLCFAIALGVLGCSGEDGEAAPPHLSEMSVESISFVADGAYTPPNAGDAPPSVDAVYVDAMGLTPEEVAERQEEAARHFARAFGADVAAAENAGRLLLVPFVVQPTVAYRATAVNGENLAEPLVVQDAGWLLTVLDPNGFELGGDFAGQMAAPGVVGSVGDYGIEDGDAVVRIKYQAARPMIVSGAGDIDFECELDSAVLGGGLARGTQRLVPDETGALLMMIQNELGFDR